MTVLLRIALASLLRAAAARASAPADEVALLQARLSQADEGSAPRPPPGQRLRTAMDLARAKSSDPDAEVSNAVQPMINFGDAQYVSYMRMGKQMITGIVDTGSFELVVFGADCSDCAVAAHYNHRLSETFEPGTLATTHNYGSGGAMCDEGFEQVSIGPYPAARQMFWEVVDASMPVLRNAAFESIIGVGPTEAALIEVWKEAQFYVKNLTTFFGESMLAPPQSVEYARRMLQIAVQLGNELPMLHTWKIPGFSICLGEQHGADGIIVWNDTSPFDRRELFVRVPVMAETHTWSASLTGAALLHSNQTSTSLGCSRGCEALIDSGTSLLAAPTTVIDGIIAAMEALDESCSNLDVLPELTFQLAGHNFSLPPSAYVARVVGEPSGYARDQLSGVRARGGTRQCELVMLDTGSAFGEAELWILGDPWFRKYYTSFELGESPKDRRFHIALHSEAECAPVPAASDMAARRGRQQLREIQGDRLHLPHPRRGASRSQWARRE